MLPYLRVKIKSLAAEAKIIRLEEKKAKKKPENGEIRESLYLHRINTVRPECRHAHLAYGFLRKRPYRVMEEKCRVKPDWSRVEYMILKFGSGDQRDLRQRFEEWRSVE